MNIEEAKANVGKMVMSRDAGYKMIRSVNVPHGPYLLKQVTKEGLAILEPKHTNPVPPSLLSPLEAGYYWVKSLPSSEWEIAFYDPDVTWMPPWFVTGMDASYDDSDMAEIGPLVDDQPPETTNKEDK